MKARRRVTILIIDNSVGLTGAFKAAFNFANYAKRDFEFLFFLPAGSSLTSKIIDAGFKGRCLPFLEIGKNFKSLILYFPVLFYNSFRLKMIVRDENIKIVQVNDFYNLVGVFAKFLGGDFSLVTYVRFMPNRFPVLLVRTWMYLNLKFAEKVICVSDAVKSQLPAHPKICTIYDTLDNQEAENRTPQISVIQQNVIQLLYLAHYIPGKGQDYALAAFYEAYQQDRRLRLKFVGGDMGLKKNKIFKQALIKEAERLGLGGCVEFTGQVEDASEEMRKADIVLNFSESESFSFVCLESLFLGKPLISTDCGGPAELFEHQKSGLLIPNKDVEAMTKAILFLIKDESLRLKLGENAKKYVVRKFSYNNTHKQLKQLFDKVLSC